MSHSKMTKRGRSHYVESWNPDAKRFINECKICGKKGFKPSILEDGFWEDYVHRAILCELERTLSPLPLDELGRCETCAKILDKNN